MARDIKKILYFREDISPFLVHLTKTTEEGIPAKNVFEKIIEQKKLIAGENPISDARFFLNSVKNKQFCRAISFTETPLNEIHCLLEIWGRNVDLESYGLVFMKDKLRKKGVSPVLYLNNEEKDKIDVVVALCQLIVNAPESAEQILPLISTFGKKLFDSTKNIDFLWEREWRYPSVKGDLEFNDKDVFMGICPDDEIPHFEILFPKVKFVDCRRNMKWYAKKLIEARKRLKVKFSVI